MNFTTEQNAILRALIYNEPSLAEFIATNDDTNIAAWLNSPSTTVWVWDKTYEPIEISASIIKQVALVDNLTAAKRDTLFWLAANIIDMSIPATITGITDICGSQTALKNAVIDGGKIHPSNAEAALRTGTGSFASPGITTWTGQLSPNDSALIRASNLRIGI